MVEATLPTFSIVTATGLVDSINPCAIGVLILLISVLLSGKKSKRRILAVGSLYIFAIYITYLAAGIGLTYFFARIPIVIAQYISIGAAALLIGAGIIEIKDFYWYGRGFSLAISPEMAKRIDRYVRNISLPGVIILGVFVAGVELPCTGGPYFAIIQVLSRNFDLTAVLLLIYYNVLFVLPLIVILFAIYFGTRIYVVKQWKQQYRAYMRLLSGLLMIFLAWLLILMANGTINIG